MRIATAAAVAGLFGFAGAANAEGMAFNARVGPTVGVYQTDSSIGITPLDPGGNTNFEQGTRRSFDSDDSWESSYGLQAGFGIGVGDFFGDIAIEYLSVDSDAVDKRTDILLTGGYLIGQHWSAFAGYRRGMQGDSAFNDDKFSEQGFFIGGGVGGIEMGPLLLGSSLAYNFSQAEDFPGDGDKFDYQGISFKASISPKSMPQHSLQLRYQRFSGDDDLEPVQFALDEDGDGVAEPYALDNVELTESYVQLSYIYAFAF